MNTALKAPITGQPARASLGWAALRLQSDEHLQDLVREGYEQAFDAIVERYRSPLLRYSATLVGGDRTEDVVQQAFEKALDHLRNDQRELQLQAWLYRVTHNAAINVLERKGSDYEQLDENYDGVPQPPDVVDRSQNIRDVFQRVNALPERQRSALMLQAVGGRSHEQIANDMHVTPPVVRQLLYRARGSLRNALGAAVPVPVIRVWLAGAAPKHAHIGELVAGAGIAKVGVTLLATSVIATGAGVEVARQQHHSSGGTTDPAAAGSASSQSSSGTSSGAGASESQHSGGDHQSGSSEDGGRGSGSSGTGSGSGGGNGGRSGSNDGSGGGGRGPGGSSESEHHSGGSGSSDSGSGGSSDSGSGDSGSDKPDDSGSGGSGGHGSDDPPS